MNESTDHYPIRKKLPHGIPDWVRGESILFVTLSCTPRGQNHLCHAPVALIIWESIAFRQRRGDWYAQLCLLMPDHLHALISFPKETNPSKAISGWKEIIAKKAGISWQRDHFDHRLRSDESHQEKADYIRQNPVRKGLVSNADGWEFVWASP